MSNFSEIDANSRLLPLSSNDFNKFKKNPSYLNNVTITKKYDGSLILLFYYNNKWIYSSRGSFNSEQSTWAKEIGDKE
jgi:hypothetical protein